MKEFTPSDRFDYDLSTRSTILDVGAHTGEFAAEMSRRHKCNINCYEPVRQFYEVARDKFKHSDSVCVFRYGLGAVPRNATHHVNGVISGEFTEGPAESVLVLGIRDELLSLGNPEVDLLNLDCAGAEYELLDAILNFDLAKHFKHIQVRFHTLVPHAAARREAIQLILNRTHEQTHESEVIMLERWTRRPV